VADEIVDAARRHHDDCGGDDEGLPGIERHEI
jgi:hypothetical protein